MGLGSGFGLRVAGGGRRADAVHGVGGLRLGLVFVGFGSRVKESCETKNPMFPPAVGDPKQAIRKTISWTLASVPTERRY